MAIRHYNALNVELKKRFSNNIQFLQPTRGPHSIDDSSDLQTLAETAGQYQFPGERSDSLFDQRHRFYSAGSFLA